MSADRVDVMCSRGWWTLLSRGSVWEMPQRWRIAIVETCGVGWPAGSAPTLARSSHL